MQLTYDIEEHEILKNGLDLIIKSQERAAKAFELQGRKATATAIRTELQAAVKLLYKLNDAASVFPSKTPQAKA